MSGRIHIPSARQELDNINLGFKKALRRSMPEKQIDSDDEREFEKDIEMEEVVMESKEEQTEMEQE